MGNLFKSVMVGISFSLFFLIALNLLKLNTSWTTLSMIFLAIFLLTFIVFSGNSASKKLSIGTVLSVLFLISAIFFGLIETDLGDGGTKIEGNYVKKDGAIYIKNGTCIITKTVYGRYPHASFDIRGNGTAEVIFRDCNPEFGFKDFHSGVVKFDTKEKIQKIVFKTDMNAISVEIGGNFTHLYAINNAEKFRTRGVKLIITGEDIWLDNFKA